MKHLLFLLLLLAVVTAFGQQTVTTPAAVVQGEDSLAMQNSVVEGIRGFEQKSDSTALAVQQQLDSLQWQLSSLQLKLDSLQGMGEDVSHLQDSLQQILEKRQALAQKLAHKQRTLKAPLAKINDLQQRLPHDFASDIALPNEALLAADIPQAALPDVAFPKEGMPALSSASIPAATLPNGITDFQMHSLPKIDSSTFSGMNADKQLEEQLLKQKHIKDLQEKVGLEEDPLKEYLQQDAKSLAQEQAAGLPLEGISAEDLSLDQLPEKAAPKQAIDHFANRKSELDRARRELNKYKGRFSEIKSLKELPKSPFKRHPLMGVRWYKRIQPGLQWQIGKGDDFRIDIGPRLSYLVTDKLELGISYQERLSIDKALPLYASFAYERVYGLNLLVSYEFRKGFYGQLSYERLNTLMRQLPHQQDPPQDKLWIQGVRLGLGKRYSIYKRLRGYSLMEYNFTRSLHAPYRQQLQVKVGVVWDKRGSR